MSRIKQRWNSGQCTSWLALSRLWSSMNVWYRHIVLITLSIYVQQWLSYKDSHCFALYFRVYVLYANIRRAASCRGVIASLRRITLRQSFCLGPLRGCLSGDAAYSSTLAYYLLLLLLLLNFNKFNCYSTCLLFYIC